MNPLPRVICLFGPTASGKTAAAIGLAKRLGGEIINADSRQVYRHMPIIAACPSAAEYAEAPHHLFEYLDPAVRTSAGAWAEEALRTVGAIRARGHTPIVVGGTGFYLKALMGGVDAVPTVPPEAEAAFAGRKAEDLYRELEAKDPELAARVKPTDTQRLTRALAVQAHTGIPLSQWQKQKAPAQPYDFTCLAISPPRALLHERIAARWNLMKDAGVVAEAQALRDRGYTPGMPGISGLGIGELWAYLDGKTGWEETTELVLAKTRQYAKRQVTWLRNQYPAAMTAEGSTELLALWERETA